MLLLFVARLETATTRLVAAVTLIAVGVALASYGELNMSMVGWWVCVSGAWVSGAVCCLS